MDVYVHTCICICIYARINTYVYKSDVDCLLFFFLAFCFIASERSRALRVYQDQVLVQHLVFLGGYEAKGFFLVPSLHPSLVSFPSPSLRMQS